MVNIRRTLARAHASGVIKANTRGALEAIAKSRFYPDRSYPAILRQAADEGLEPTELEAFRAWLPGGRVDQKREDALAMLRQMRAWAATAPARKLVRYSFAHTDAWQMACQQAGTQLPTEDVDAESSERDELLDELRLDPDAFADARSRALLRLLAEGYARRQGFTVTPALRLDTTNRFRRDHGLLQPDQLDNWLAQRRLGREQFLRLMEDEARLRWVQDQLTQEIIAGIADWGRLEDDYPRLLARAEEKRRHWQAQGLQRAALSDLGLTESGLLRWYFVARLGRPLPANVARFAQAAGFTDTDAFCRAVLREYCYVTGAGAAPRQEAAP
jgi:hypothetical protein